jgi:Ca-activated chloride channel family protein
MRRGPALAAALAVSLSALAAAQVYRGGTDVVLLSVTVVDRGGRHMPGLTREDFRIWEDAVLQDITHFATQPEPISLSLLIDTSTSMDTELPIAQQAAAGLIGRLGPQDVAQLVDFDGQTRVLAPFTGDKALLEAALKLMRAGGSTSLYNAIYTSLSELKRHRGQMGAEPRRQAIVLLSDGEDTSSIVEYADVLELAKRSEVIVYAVGLVAKDAPSTKGWNEADFVLRSLTRDTGGRLFYVSDPTELPAVYVQISDELSNQYSIGYISKNSKRDGAWRKITLQVLKGDAAPRTRGGYYAPAGTR